MSAQPFHSQKTGGSDPYNLPEIQVQLRWRSDATLRWYATGGATFTAQVRDAISRWQSAVPSLAWEEMYSQGSEDVLFELKGEGQCNPSPASYDFTVRADSPDWWRKANYTTYNNICIENISELSADWQRRAMLLHEIGHVYGLNERYGTDATCNSREYTVMDTVRETSPDSWYFCEGAITGPSSLDIQRVDTYWGKGVATPPGLEAAGLVDNPVQVRTDYPGVLNALWGDGSWGQTSFNVWLQIEYAGAWYYVSGSGHWIDEDVGIHQLMTIEGIPEYQWDPPPPMFPNTDMRAFEQAYTVNALLGIINGAYYRVVVWADNYGYGSGPGKVSDRIWIQW